jgi:GNAT superfamily N-acetyltransferase
MTRADVDPAAAAILAGDWGDRRVHLELSVGKPFCHVFVAEIEGEIVGTAMGTANGSVGWVGLVFVAPSHRGRGLGAGLTAAAIETLEAAGCRTLVLVATELGRPLYERLGFRLATTYRTYAVQGLPSGPSDPAIRPFDADDTAAIVDADRLATGEDRALLLEALIEAGSGWVLSGADGEPLGHVLRPPWGGGSTIAHEPAHALRLLDHRRRVSGPSATAKCGILEENVEGRRLLEAAGWTLSRTHPRLVRGEPLDWRPTSIWGQLNFALG